VIAAARSNLSDAERGELKELTKYGDNFAMKSSDYKWTAKVHHHIHIAEANRQK
jgi:hypothetical protein